jgi:hypothetical protein
MATLVIKSFPDDLHARLKATAAAHRRSVTKESIHLIEQALTSGTERPAGTEPYWSKPALLPEYRALVESGELRTGTDSAAGLSDEREAR